MTRIELRAPDGTLEHVYQCDRLWGRIEWKGRIYRSQHKAGKPTTYVRDE